MNAFRWILVVPAAIAAWYAVFVLGLSSYFFVDSHLCPPEDVVSGHCNNASTRALLHVTTHAFVAASTFAVMISTVLVAPRHKKSIAWLSFVVGTLVAAYIAGTTRAWTLFAAAFASGLAALAIILHLLQRGAPNNALRRRAKTRA